MKNIHPRRYKKKRKRKTLENTLRSLRKQNKKTATEVAAVLGVSRSTYSNYEQGIREIDIRLIIPLADLFGTSAEDIILAQLTSIKVRSTN